MQRCAQCTNKRRVCFSVTFMSGIVTPEDAKLVVEVFERLETLNKRVQVQPDLRARRETLRKKVRRLLSTTIRVATRMEFDHATGEVVHSVVYTTDEV
jgi:hypothetical protein